MSAQPQSNASTRTRSRGNDTPQVMALWCPDWPTYAVRSTLDLDTTTPVIVTGPGRERNTVKACCHQARACGVRRGMRIRAAQAVCPQAVVHAWDEDLFYQVFEQCALNVGDVVASVEVIRPGLLVVRLDRAAKFWGSVDKAATMLIDAMSLPGSDVRVGVASTIPTALLAARASAHLSREQEPEFLSQVNLHTLLAEESLHCDVECVQALWDVGVRTCGDLARLEPTAVMTRFGRAGMHCYEIATGRDTRLIAPAETAEDLRVSIDCEPPLARVDQAAFIARSLSRELHEKLADFQLICHRLQVQVTCETTDGTQVLERMWRTRDPLDEKTTADRIRWQLDGWITHRLLSAAAAARAAARTATQTATNRSSVADGSRMRGSDAEGFSEGYGAAADSFEDYDSELESDGYGITHISLIPVEATPPGRGEGLFASPNTSRSHASMVASRVQTLLGMDQVLSPYPRGGVSPAERIGFEPWGDQEASLREKPATQRRWEGKILGPLPGQAHTMPSGTDDSATRVVDHTQAVQIRDAAGRPVYVTAEVLLNAEPATVHIGDEVYTVTGWAGPWPVDTGWWTQQSTRLARCQLTAIRPGSDTKGGSPWGSDDAVSRHPAARGSQSASPRQHVYGWLLTYQEHGWHIEASYH